MGACWLLTVLTVGWGLGFHRAPGRTRLASLRSDGGSSLPHPGPSPAPEPAVCSRERPSGSGPLSGADRAEVRQRCETGPRGSRGGGRTCFDLVLAGTSEDLFETSRRLWSCLVEFLSFLREVCACFKGANMFMTEVLSEEDRVCQGVASQRLSDLPCAGGKRGPVLLDSRVR